MLDLLAAAIAFTVVLAVLLAALTAVTVVPFVLTLQEADARRFGPTRWGAVALAGIGLGLLLALVVERSEASRALVLLPLALTWLGPLAVRLVPEGSAVGGRVGAHE